MCSLWQTMAATASYFIAIGSSLTIKFCKLMKFKEFNEVRQDHPESGSIF